ncbi:MAG: HD domain-containing protein [Candidatus Absconditabacteria bacterium]|nr:HD domain-containing protein [Candidatus Absconditabacteria bacterium]
MEKYETNQINNNDNKTIVNEEYFLVDTQNEKILTKIQYTKRGGESLSFVNGQRISNYIGFNKIQNDGQIINKESFEKELNNKENNMKMINNIKNELDYIISLERTEKRFLEILDIRKDLDKNRILNALNFAKEKHLGQVRDEGSPYIIHPMSVAIYAMKDGLDTDSIIVALLHDVVEDTKDDFDQTQKDILNIFGNKVLLMINSLSKRIGNDTKNLDKYYQDINNDLFLSKIKGFDRLHNIYSLFLQPKQDKIEIYIGKTEKEILPLILGTETYYNIKSIIEIIKKNKTDFDFYKSKIRNIKEINNIKKKL